MAAATTIAAITAATAAAGAGAQAIAARKQTKIAKRAERRAMKQASLERERQAEIEAIQTAKETEQAATFREQQRRAATGRIGRRSLLTGSALGVQSTLG